MTNVLQWIPALPVDFSLAWKDMKNQGRNGRKVKERRMDRRKARRG
jgi:hypothetical protein